MNKTIVAVRAILSLTLLVLGGDLALSQRVDSTARVITFDEVYDSPYAINQLFIHIQPVYGELFVTNVNVGFGLQVDYSPNSKWDVSAHWRRAYAKATDFSREVGLKNQENSNKPRSFNYLELGGTYHLSDKEYSSKTKIILYSKRYEGKRWSTTKPKTISIPSKVRKVYGLRFGGVLYRSATDLARALKEQNTSLLDPNGAPLVGAKLYGNVDAKIVYLGGSLGWIKNFAIRPHRDFGVLVNDLIFNSYVDIMYAPALEIDDVLFNNVAYSTEPLNTSPLGFRLGVNGKFNKKIGYGYGVELGYRPGLEGRTFYTMFKISFPLIGLAPDSKNAIVGN